MNNGKARPLVRAGFPLKKMSGNRKHILASFCTMVAVFTVAVLPFIRAWEYGIINLDDYWYVSAHESIMAGVGWAGIKFGFTCLEEGIWMPLTWLSYMLDYSIFGADWGKFHIHSIFVHGINAILVWCLMSAIWRRIADGRYKGFSNLAIPAVVTALWAAHPLRCESVVFIASRKDVLSLMWMLLALLSWIRHGEICKSGNKWAAKWYMISLACFAFAAMAKPSVMTFPLLCFIFDFFIARKVRPLEYVIPLLAAGFLGWFAGHAQAVGGATENVTGAPMWYKLVNAATSFGLYLWNTVWPAKLATQCVLKYPDWPRFCIPGVFICGVAAFWLVRKGLRYWNGFMEHVKVEWRGFVPSWDVGFDRAPVFAGLAWFALSVAPMLGIAGFGYHAMADRFTYIPAIGLGIASLGALATISKRFNGVAIRSIIGFASVLAVLGYAAATWRQTGYWKNDHTLFSRTAEIDGEKSAPAHGILANWYFEFPHDLEKCVEHFQKVKAVNLRYVEMSFQIYVFALCELGRETEIPELLKMYDGWIRKESEENPRFGKDSIRSKMMRTVYFFSRVAYLITQPDLRKAAKEELENVSCSEDEPCFLYLKWRLASAEGDEKKAEEAKREMLCKTAKKGYTRFRYLRGDCDYGKEAKK